jgi:D-alanyl-D-alanine carboxypeptidase
VNAGISPPAARRPTVPPIFQSQHSGGVGMTAQPYVIFFRGLDGLIDESAAERLAKNRGCDAVFFRYSDWSAAAVRAGGYPDTPYHVVGFSRGAAPDIMGGFMAAVRKHNWRLPEDLMTVGLYGPTGAGFTTRYADPHFECINFLDSSGQRHVGEHNAVNLGAHVPHLGAGSGMELAADMFADGKNPLAPAPPLAGSASEEGNAQPRAPLPWTPAGIDLSALAKPAVPAWPHDDNDSLFKFYGRPRTTKLTHFVPPFTMIDEDTKKAIDAFDVHPKCLGAFTGVFNELWLACGKDQAVVERHHLHIYSGCFNPRMVRGSTTHWSVHAFAAAIDINSQGAPFEVDKRPSQENMPDFAVAIWKRFGATWGGNFKRKDWMHFQFVREGAAP